MTLKADIKLEKILNIHHVSSCVKLIPVSQIRTNENQPRRTIDTDQLNALAESIRKYGLLHPVSVRQVEEGGYEIVSGERRYRAAIVLKMPRIPAVILSDMSTMQSEQIAIHENFQRQDLNIVDKARVITELMSDNNIDNVAKDLVCSRRTIERYVMVHRELSAVPELYELALKWADKMDMRSAIYMTKVAHQLMEIKSSNEDAFQHLITSVRGLSLTAAIPALREALKQPGLPEPKKISWACKRTGREIVVTLRMAEMNDEQLTHLQTQIEKLIAQKEVSL